MATVPSGNEIGYRRADARGLASIGEGYCTVVWGFRSAKAEFSCDREKWDELKRCIHVFASLTQTEGSRPGPAKSGRARQGLNLDRNVHRSCPEGKHIFANKVIPHLRSIEPRMRLVSHRSHNRKSATATTSSPISNNSAMIETTMPNSFLFRRICFLALNLSFAEHVLAGMLEDGEDFSNNLASDIAPYAIFPVFSLSGSLYRRNMSDYIQLIISLWRTSHNTVHESVHWMG